MSSAPAIITDQPGLEALAARLRERSTVLAWGHFNVIHPGHQRFLAHARAQGDVLVVALIGDRELAAGGQDHFPQADRAANLAARSDIDHVVVLDALDLEQVIRSLSPLAFVLGTEFEEEHAERVARPVALVRELGGRVLYHSGAVAYSGESSLGRRIDEVARSRRAAYRAACARQGIDLAGLAGGLASLRDRSVLVVGDTIVDQYVSCDALGMSAEAPVLVLKELEAREFVGAAGVVACHIRALGARCRYLSLVGDDAPGRMVADTLARRGVEAVLLTDPERPTTYKIRYLVGKQKLLRVSRLSEAPLPRALERNALERIQALVAQSDAVVVSDFVYGMVTARVLEAVVEAAHARGIPLYGDLQCSSQVGSVLKFKRFDLICPNEREARIALGDNRSGLEKIARRLLARTECGALALTLGPDGFVLYERGGERSESFPALDPNPLDVTGAGDALLSAMAVAGAAGWPLMRAGALAAGVAALAVGRMGNVPIPHEEVASFLSRLADETA
ncbi:MAG: PfkB family carbohydrate kinase [Planctomycetes bacterium]|nr:PfkB family carbohydrate kinase [Planctomycetota bacterium]